MTELIYIHQPTISKLEATIQEVINSDRGTGIVLDKTIFYVQGGGQPSDIGIITINGNQYDVAKVMRLPISEVVHYTNAPFSDVQEGGSVHLEVDMNYRNTNSKSHSAGHMIDVLMNQIHPEFEPGKGHHYPDGSYVEFDTNGEEINREDLIQSLQTKADKFIAQNVPIHIIFDETRSMHGQPLRIMSFEGYKGCPCGGTHVSNSSELKGFAIRKIKQKGNTIKVSYTV
jgi:alanyl-tRNA synthetase